MASLASGEKDKEISLMALLRIGVATEAPDDYMPDGIWSDDGVMSVIPP